MEMISLDDLKAYMENIGKTMTIMNVVAVGVVLYTMQAFTALTERGESNE